MMYGRLLQRSGAALMVGAFIALGTSVPASQQSPSQNIAQAVSPSPIASPSATQTPQTLASPSATPDAVSTPSNASIDIGSPTAVGALPASFISPNAGDASPIEATQVVVSTVRGAVIALSVNNVPVDYKHLGKRVVNNKTGETQFFFYGVPLVEGPNTVTAVALGADGIKGQAVSETVYGPGLPATVKTQMVQHLIADGFTAVPINVFVTDRFGHAAMPSQRVHISIVSGDVHFVDLPKEANSQTPHPSATPTPNVIDSPDSQADKVLEMPLPVGGYFSFKVAPGTVAGIARFEISVGDAHVTQEYYVEPYVRKTFVNGIVEGGAGSVPEAIDGDGNYDGGGARKGRVGLYATGAVGRSLLTVAYESQNRLSPVSSFGSFENDPNDRPYITYGDASQNVAPYHSEDHLFARIDRGSSNAMWGQFNAKVGPDDLGGFSELLNGADVNLSVGKSQRTHLTAFTARNDQAFVSQTLPVTGLASLVQNLEPNIVVGSDSLTLVALDRKTGLPVTQTALIRNVDYTIDYATGVLRFINIPLPYDPNFNPQVIYLQYEYAGPGVRSQTTGAQLAYDLAKDGHTRVLASTFNDAAGTQNFAVAAQSLTDKWNGGNFTISHATSFGSLPDVSGIGVLGSVNPTANGGSALSVALNNRTPKDSLSLAYQKTDAGYSDPFGGFNSPGVTAYRASYARGTAASGQVTMTYSGEHNDGIGTDSSENDFAVQFLKSLGHYFTATLGLVYHDQRVGNVVATPTPIFSSAPVALSNTSQTQLDAGLAYHHQKVGVAVSEDLTLSGSDTGSTQPTQTMAEASYDLPKHGRFFIRELWSDEPSAVFANSTSNLGINGTSTHSTQIGVEQAISPATTISSQYVVDQTGSGLNVYDALGVDEHVHIGPRITAQATVQGANAVGAGAVGFTVLGSQITYVVPGNALRATFGYQTRTGTSGGSTLNAGIAGHLSPNLGVAGFVQHAYGPESQGINDRFSFAYRPLGNDRFISLLGYTRTNGASIDGSANGVFSFEELYRPTESTEIAGRAAFEESGANTSYTQSLLYALRVRHYFSNRNDLGVEFRTISNPQAVGARATSVAVEAGHTLGSSTRLAAGYNISGAVDQSLLGQPARKGVYVTVTTLIDHLFGWGKP